jgi:hypothetical protein
MKRYYICDIIGDGIEPETAFRAAIADILKPGTQDKAFNITTIISTDPVTGHPLLPWCLVIASGQDHSLAIGKPKIDDLPDFPLDAKIGALQTATKNRMKANINARGLDASFVDNADGFRDVIREIGRKHFHDFNENAFDVAE